MRLEAEAEYGDYVAARAAGLVRFAYLLCWGRGSATRTPSKCFDQAVPGMAAAAADRGRRSFPHGVEWGGPGSFRPIVGGWV
jgi:hypothetical protein